MKRKLTLDDLGYKGDYDDGLGFEEPEFNTFQIGVSISDLRKRDALKIAEAFRSILDHEGHEGTSRVVVSHVKYDG